MKKLGNKSPLWIIGSFVSLAAILLGITVGTVLTSRKVPFWPKAEEGCMSVTLEPGYSWDNPDYSSNYTIKFKACNDFDSWFNTSAWFTSYDSDYIWSAGGGWGLPNPINPGECKKGTLTINMDDSWTGSPVAQAKFIVAARDFCIGTGCTGCYHDEYITLTFGSGETPPPEEKECFDSDVTTQYPNGKNYYTKGYVDDFGDRRWDNCFDENTLTEFYCEQAPGQTRPSRGASQVNCPEGCEDGVCLGEEPPPEPPPAPTNLSVATGKNCTADPPVYSSTLSWTGSAGADGYVADICNTSDPWSTCQHWTPHNVGTQTTLELTGLDCNQNYYWRVWAYTGGDPSQNGTHGYPTNPFFTIDCCGEEPGNKPDLKASNITYSPDPINAGDAVDFYFTYSNMGNVAAPTNSWQVFIDGNIVHDSVLVGLEPDASQVTTAFRDWMASDGVHTIRIVVDTRDVVDESNEDNNEATLTFIVGQGPNLTVSNIGYDPKTIQVGEDVWFYYTYSNTGNETARLTKNKVFVDDIEIDYYFVDSIDAGLSIELGGTSGWTATTEGQHTVRIVADFPNWAEEIDEHDNEALLTFSVGGAGAGLSVAGLGHTPPSVDVGDNVRFQFTYSNVGDAPLPGSPDTPYLYVKAYVDDELVTEEGVYEGLGAGESKKYTTEGFWTATAGSHTVRAVVESPLLEEPDTTDNEAVLAMTVPTPAGEGPAGQVCNVCGCTASGGDCGGQQCSQKCHQCLAKDRKWIADENRYEYAYTYTILGCLPVKPASFVIWFLRFAMGIGGGIAFLFMVMGVFKVLTSQGDVNKLIDGKKMISRAILGILVIVFAVIILRIIGFDILRLPGFSPGT